MPAIIAYYRMSTQKQGRSGLGLEAQRKAIAAFAAAERFDIAGEYTEIETGKGADALARRPQLKAALKAAKAAKCCRRRQTRPPVTRCRVYCRPDVATCAFHRHCTG